MELLSPLRQLSRARPLILAARACSARGCSRSRRAATGRGPLASPERRSAIATAEVQIDTARPLAADLRASTATIAEQAVMLGESLAGRRQRAA